METSGVYFDSLNTFILSVKLENIRLGTSLNILATQNLKHKLNQYFRACNMLLTNNADVTHNLQKNRVLFSKQSGLPS